MGEADSVDSAAEKVKDLNPDLILLDIQMPGRNGFELIRELRENNCFIDFIFVTAYDQYALKALKISAFDYLLKPVDPRELGESIEKFRIRKKQQDMSSKMDELLALLDDSKKIRFNFRTGYILIDPNEIIYCKADGNYTELILMDNRSETVTMTLGKVKESLPDNKFFKISRSYMINLDFLVMVDRKSGKCKLQADRTFTLTVAKSRIRVLDKIFRN